MPIGPQPISTARPTRLNVYLVEEPARLRFEFRGLPTRRCCSVRVPPKT
jgi:hypothetical protein